VLQHLDAVVQDEAPQGLRGGCWPAVTRQVGGLPSAVRDAAFEGEVERGAIRAGLSPQPSDDFGL
jgi:hypothetical protein